MAADAIQTYGPENPNINGDKVIWVVWYTAVAEDATLALTLGGQSIDGMTPCDDDNTVGYHYGYKSFAEGSPAIQYGETYTVSVTVDSVTDTIDVTPINMYSYDVFLDEGWFGYPEGEDNDTTYDVEVTMTAGQMLYLPNTAYDGMVLKNWALVDANDEVIRTYNGGSTVVIGQIPVPADHGQEYHFVAQYQSPSLEELLGEAMGFAGNYTWSAEQFEVFYDYVYAYYGEEYYNAIQSMNLTVLENIRDDFSRFMGGLYRASADAGTPLSSVEFNGVTYHWNTAGTLKGSNWEADDGTRLHNALATYALGLIGSEELYGEVVLIVTDCNGVETEMTYASRSTSPRPSSPSTRPSPSETSRPATSPDRST